MAKTADRELGGIETVGQLRAALEGVPDERTISDIMGEPLYLGFWNETGDEEAWVVVV